VSYKPYVRRSLFSLCLFLIVLPVRAQDRQIDILPVSPRDTTFSLSREFVLHLSDTVRLDGVALLQRGVHYILEYRHGINSLRGSLRDSLLSDSSQHTVHVSYEFLPVSLKRDYARRVFTVPPDSSGETTTRFTPVASQAFSFDDAFNPSLQKSGSLTRGFTIGSNRDLTLNSGFRMQLAGPLSRDVDLVAVLTDENTPLQPEGTTETLQEVDRVFVEMKHPSAEATLGDFNEHIDVREGGEFGRLTRKLQGAKGTVRTSTLFGEGSGARVSLSAGGARGKYHTNDFRGQEGNQGPYRLTGLRGERQIIVIAGSERVYVDGLPMKRGEINDYTIDYGAAQITFTTQRLITNASRITVDFEFSDRHYERNFFSGLATVRGVGGAVRLTSLFVQETDDPDSPVEATLTEETRAILARSGNDELKASIPGIRFVGRDSLTGASRGVYLLTDTAIAGRNYLIAVHAPGDSQAVYVVTFSPVKTMPPDSAGYERIGLGHFRFAGIGRGTHLPLTIIPLPSLHQFANVTAAISIVKDLEVSGEVAGSRFDPNRLSSLDDQNAGDGAYRFSARYAPRSASLAGVQLGTIDLRYSERFQGERFIAPDRVNEVEFARKWNFDTAAQGDELIREASASLMPLTYLNIRGGYGFYDRQSKFQSSRSEGEIVAGDSAQRHVRYGAEHIASRDRTLSRRSVWLRHGGQATVQWGVLRPSLRFEAEERTLTQQTTNTQEEGGFRFSQWSPRVQTGTILGMAASVEVQVRREDSTFAGGFRPAFRSVAQIFNWKLHEWYGVRASAVFSAKRTRFESGFRARGNVDSDVLAVRSVVQYIPANRGVETDVFYEFSNQRSTRLERVYVRVPRGEGNYRYLGDVNGNAIADDHEFELTRFDGEYIVVFLPGETLYPVADVKASARIRIRPARFIDKTTTLGSWVSALSSETYLRVDERSSDPTTSNVSLLRFSTFLDHVNTITGSQLMTQDLYIFEYDPQFSTRLRTSWRKGLVQLVNSVEQSRVREHSARVRSQPVPEIGNETEILFRTERVIGSRPGPRDRDLFAVSFTSDIAYRPVREWEVGFRLTVEKIRDRFSGDDAVADLNDQSLRGVVAFPGRGQVRAELTREETILSRPSNISSKVYPFEFTKGRLFGKSLLWLLGADYRVTGNIQLSVQYSGRSEAGRPPVHTARAEAKAFF
jgi:hypothetical protein